MAFSLPSSSSLLKLLDNTRQQPHSHHPPVPTPPVIRDFNHDDNANENVAWEYMFALLVVLRGFSNSFNLHNVAELSRNGIGGSGVQAEPENEKFVAMCSRSPQSLKFRNFTLLFCQGRWRNVPKFITHVQGIIFLIKSCCFMTFPLPSYLLKLPVGVEVLDFLASFNLQGFQRCTYFECVGATILHKLTSSILPRDNKGIVFKTVTANRFAKENIKNTRHSRVTFEWKRVWKIFQILYDHWQIITVWTKDNGFIKLLIDWFTDWQIDWLLVLYSNYTINHCIGQNGATLTHINEPWRRPVQAQTFNESATIREKMEEFGEDGWLKLPFGSFKTRVSWGYRAAFCSLRFNLPFGTKNDWNRWE